MSTRLEFRVTIFNLFASSLTFTTSKAALKCRLDIIAYSFQSKALDRIACKVRPAVEVLLDFLNLC